MATLGYETAKSVVRVGRSAFFGSLNSDLPTGRTAQLQVDDLTPQFDFVGPAYTGTRVLLLGINPGNGPRNDKRTRGDEQMMPAHIRFAKEPSESNFVSASQAYKRECQAWPLWNRHCQEVIGAGKLEFSEIAYSNCLPWRTQSGSKFSEDVAENAARNYVHPLVGELNPRIVVAMGKRAAEILAKARLAGLTIITWNRAQAATALVREERAQTAKIILEKISLHRG